MHRRSKLPRNGTHWSDRHRCLKLIIFKYLLHQLPFSFPGELQIAYSFRHKAEFIKQPTKSSLFQSQLKSFREIRRQYSSPKLLLTVVKSNVGPISCTTFIHSPNAATMFKPLTAFLPYFFFGPKLVSSRISSCFLPSAPPLSNWQYCYRSVNSYSQFRSILLQREQLMTNPYQPKECTSLLHRASRHANRVGVVRFYSDYFNQYSWQSLMSDCVFW
jgi:hypothetical protein